MLEQVNSTGISIYSEYIFFFLGKEVVFLFFAVDNEVMKTSSIPDRGQEKRSCPENIVLPSPLPLWLILVSTDPWIMLNLSAPGQSVPDEHSVWW